MAGDNLQLCSRSSRAAPAPRAAAVSQHCVAVRLQILATAAPVAATVPTRAWAATMNGALGRSFFNKWRTPQKLRQFATTIADSLPMGAARIPGVLGEKSRQYPTTCVTASCCTQAQSCVTSTLVVHSTSDNAALQAQGALHGRHAAHQPSTCHRCMRCT